MDSYFLRVIYKWLYEGRYSLGGKTPGTISGVMSSILIAIPSFFFSR